MVKWLRFINPLHQMYLWHLLLLTPLVRAAPDVTVYGIAPAFEGEFLTEAFQDLSYAAGTDGVVTVVDQSATDEILAHGVYGVTMIQSANGLVFQAQGTAYSESMSCIVDLRAGRATCTEVAVVGESTVHAVFTPTQLPIVTVIQAAAASSPSSTSAHPSQSPAPSASQGSHSSGLSSGAIAGIVVAIVVVALIAIIGLVIFLRRRRLRIVKPKDGPANLEAVTPYETRERDPQQTSDGIAPLRRKPTNQPDVQPSEVLPSTPFDARTVASSTLASSASPLPASPLPVKNRELYAANTASEDGRTPNATESSFPISPSDAGRSEASANISANEARQILDEMRRMREEVANYRAEIPPEYTE